MFPKGLGGVFVKNISAGLAIVVTTCTLIGCATAPPRISGPGDQNAFLQARYECLKEVPNTSVSSGYVGLYGGSTAGRTAPSCGAIESCMALKGYVNDPNGKFQVPQSQGVYCIK